MFVSTTGSDVSGDGTAEKPFLTIRHGVGMNFHGTVILAAGTYSGVGNINIDPRTTAAVSSKDAMKTMIDCADQGLSAFTIGSSTLKPKRFFGLSGVAVLNCLSSAIVFSGGGLTTNKCNFTSNSGDNGGAISISNGKLISINDTFLQNNAANRGGAVYATASTVTIISSQFLSNNAQLGGALAVLGEAVSFSEVNLIHNSAKVLYPSLRIEIGSSHFPQKSIYAV